MANEDMLLPIAADILALNPERPEIVEMVKSLTLKSIADWSPTEPIKDDNLRRIELTKLSYREIDELHFHWTLAKNMSSIAKTGLVSCVGRNSKKIDREKDEAIYVSKGVTGVLNCSDIWLKWRYNIFFNIAATQFPFKIHRKLNLSEYKTLGRYSIMTADTITNGSFLNETEKLEAVFNFQMNEQLNSKYLAVSMQPGVDYDVIREDRKKASASMVSYARVIYGDGVSTDFSNDYAEEWNVFTPLGEHQVINPERLAVLTVDGKEDMLSVLDFMYHAYGIYCIKSSKEPLNLETLKRFIEYSRKNRK